MQSDGNLNADEEPRQETGNEIKQDTNDVKTYENEGQAEEGGGSGSSSKLKMIIGIVVAAVVVIVVVVVLVVVLTDDDDDEDTYGQILSWDEAYKKAEEDLKKYKLEDKAQISYNQEVMSGECGGSISPNKKRGFPGMCLQDGPSGVRPSASTQSWQAAINTAATFDRQLMYDVGKAQGKEFKDKGVDVALGPCTNLLRNPKGGRVWEAYGEDPFLSGETVVEVIKGIQDSGMIACVKHFVANEAEYERMKSTSNVDDQALFEIYIDPFYKAITKADVASIMESYNAVNGTFMTKNKRLLTDVLKTKFGFKGFITSDWFAIYTKSPEHLIAGLDMDQPGAAGWDQIPTWVEQGLISEDRIHDAAKRILATMYRFGRIKSKLKDEDLYPNTVDLDIDTLTDQTKELNRKAVRDSIVLLKNSENVLPLYNPNNPSNTVKKIAVIGNNAESSIKCLTDLGGCIYNNETNRYWEGTMVMGYGSGTTRFTYFISPLDAIKEKVNELRWTLSTSTELTTDADPRKRTEVLTGLSSKCSDADITLVFIGAITGEEIATIEGQNGDRANLDAWHKGTELVNQVLNDCPNTNIILIVYGPATVNIDAWVTEDKVKGILFGGYPGAECGNGLVDILFGDYSPSGHLPFVWATEGNYLPINNKTYTGSDDLINSQYDYDEGLFIGQRYFDKNNKAYHYPFGYGLSYSEFTFSDLNLNMAENGLTVTFKVENTGNYKAKVVAMVFLGFPLDNYPAKVLKGFDKKELDIDESTTFTILIEPHDLSYYDTTKADYVRPTSGTFKVYVGENARDNK